LLLLALVRTFALPPTYGPCTDDATSCAR